MRLKSRLIVSVLILGLMAAYLVDRSRETGNLSTMSPAPASEPVPADALPPFVPRSQPPNFDDPSQYWPDAKRVSSIAEATPLLKFNPVTGRNVSIGEEPSIVVSNGVMLLHFRKARVFVTEGDDGYFSNEMAKQFVENFGASAGALGTKIELVDLGRGFLGALISGQGSVMVQFGTDGVIFQAVSPPGVSGRGRVLSLAKEIVSELADISPPGTAPRENATTPGSNPKRR
jgi:hypothetical protein